MKSHATLKKLIGPGLLLAALGLTSGPALAVDYYLIAKETTLSGPDGPVPMWGFAVDAGGACYAAPSTSAVACTAPVATVPGPRLDAGTGSTSDVTIYLTNLLQEPVSIVIPGQQMPAPSGPTWLDGSVGPAAGGGLGVRRVRSFGLEAAPGAGTQVFRWTGVDSNAFQAGTYAYHSGTHPQVQVQMGLYGAITGDAATGEAYAGVPYDNEVLLLYSEIDPALHADVDLGTYGTTGLTSTIGYQPRFYLINGEAFNTSTADITGPVEGARTLLRMINMGLENHSAVLQNLRMSLVAEDGKVYPYAREQYSALLPAGKTKDAIVIPSATGTYAVYDGQLGLGNGTSETGGMLRRLAVVAGGANMPPTADPQSVAFLWNTLANPITLTGNDPDNLPSPLTYAVVSGPSHGTLGGAAPAVTYTPDVGFIGNDSFAFTVDDGGAVSAPATVSILVYNDAPTANAGPDQPSVSAGATVTLDGSLSSDPNGDPLTYAWSLSVPAGSGAALSDATAVMPTFVADVPGTYTGTLIVSDAASASAPDTVDVTVPAPSNLAPVCSESAVTVDQNVTTTINLIANCTDVDGAVIPTSLAITVDPRRGSLVDNMDGTVDYTPNTNFKGSDNFRYTFADDDGAVSVDDRGKTGGTKVRVNVK